MNKRIIRVSALMAALLMSLALLFACTDNETAGGTDTTADVSAQTEESTKSDTSETEKKSTHKDTEKKEGNTTRPASGNGASKVEGADDVANDIFH